MGDFGNLINRDESTMSEVDLVDLDATFTINVMEGIGAPVQFSDTPNTFSVRKERNLYL